MGPGGRAFLRNEKRLLLMARMGQNDEMKIRVACVVGLTLGFAGGAGVDDSLGAEPLKSAKVTALHNEVVIGKEGQAERAAAKDDEVQGRDRLRTGRKSRAELEFVDKSIARLGSNTVFSFDAKGREMNLQRGTALIHVPPGLSGARISTPAATAAIHGDVVAMRVAEGGATQIVALSKDAQGPITVTFNKTGESRTLQPGELLTINPADLRLPEPVTISVEVFTQSSALVKGDQGFAEELPRSAKQEIRQTETVQQQEIRSGGLEGVQQVAVQMDASLNTAGQTPGTDIAVQTASGSRIAGTYVGRWVDIAPSTDRGTITMNFHPDGTVTGAGVNTADNHSFAFTGTYSNDGRFNFVDTTPDGDSGSGQFQFGDNTVSGVVNHSTSSGGGPAVANLQATRQ